MPTGEARWNPSACDVYGALCLEHHQNSSRPEAQRVGSVSHVVHTHNRDTEPLVISGNDRNPLEI